MNLHFEQLESRLLLAASIRQRGRNLVITGDNDANLITITGNGEADSVLVDLNNDGDFTDPSEGPYTGVANIVIRGKDGNDAVTVRDLNITGNLRFLGGKGDDSGSIVDSNIGGKVFVNGQQGTDTWEDLGGNTFNPKKTPNVKVESTTTTPLNPLQLVNDVLETNEGRTIQTNLFENDAVYLSENLDKVFLTEISGNNLADSSYDATGKLSLPLAHGTVTVNSKGVMEYSANLLVSGDNVEDSFTYTVKDLDGNEATATVTIKVLGNIDDSVTLTENGDGFDLGGASADLRTNDGTGAGEITQLIFDNSILPPDSDFDFYADVAFAVPGTNVAIRTRDAVGSLAKDTKVGTLNISATGVVTFTFEPGAAKEVADNYNSTTPSSMLFFQYTLASGPRATTGFVTLNLIGQPET